MINQLHGPNQHAHYILQDDYTLPSWFFNSIWSSRWRAQICWRIVPKIRDKYLLQGILEEQRLNHETIGLCTYIQIRVKWASNVSQLRTTLLLEVAPCPACPALCVCVFCPLLCLVLTKQSWISKMEGKTGNSWAEHSRTPMCCNFKLFRHRTSEERASNNSIEPRRGRRRH